MEPHTAAKILVLAHDENVARQWADLLRQHDDCVVCCGLAEAPNPRWPEVVLLDGDFPVWELVDASAEEESLSGGVEMGFLRAGGSEPADVHLPADASPRELHLACSLLAEVVRLRRQVRLGSETHRRLSRQALTDSLSGLPNRRAWEAAFAARLAAVTESSSPLCVAVLDIDCFKQLNDQYGHAVGDEVLRGVGRVFRESLRHDDFVARLGGDEFGLLLWLPDHAAAGSVVERVRSSIGRHHRQIEGITVTASAGYHVIPGGTPLPCPVQSMSLADTALREAKRAGRDRTVEGV